MRFFCASAYECIYVVFTKHTAERLQRDRVVDEEHIVPQSRFLRVWIESKEMEFPERNKV